jgi:hypothetical protein
VDAHVTVGFDMGRSAVVWLFAAFVVTFTVTRVIVRLIRSGKDRSGTRRSAECTCITMCTGFFSYSLLV